MTFEFDPKIFSPVLLPYVEDPHKIQLFTGNRGSGKSIFLYQRAVLFALSKKYFRLLYCRKVADTVRKSTFQGIKDVIAEWGLGDYFRVLEGSMDIHCKHNGNMMISHGLDKPEKLKSIKDISHVLFDEMTESNFDDYAQLEALIRTKKAKGQFWGAFNPEAEFWGREYFFLDHESDTIPLGEVAARTKDTLIYKASFEQNPFIDAVSYKDKLIELAMGDENYNTVWVEGNWGKITTGGEFLNKFKKSIHVKDVAYIPGLPVHITFDFNVLPYMTMLAAQVVYDKEIINGIEVAKYTVRFFKEYCLKQPLNTTESCVGAFLDDYGKSAKDVFIYGDAMGNKRHEGTGNKTEFKKVKEILGKYGEDGSDRTFRHNPSVLQTRSFVNKCLASMAIIPGIYISIEIDKGMVTTISDMENTKIGVDGVLKERYTDKKTGQSWEKYSHCVDALRYLIIKMFEDYYRAFTV